MAAAAPEPIGGVTIRPALKGRPPEGSPVNRAEEAQLSCVFSRVYPAFFWRPALQGRPGSG